ncbi:uncharacterized protein PG998_013121 [Apiospora kogelbergensis]|uniref:uncharacterized protein n=1 Tax=Apiospora kogelbergensis TaxID=1337665 RepID=UPI003130E34E
MQFKSFIILSLSLANIANSIGLQRNSERSGSVAAMEKRQKYAIYASGKDEDALDKRQKYAIYAAGEDEDALDKRQKYAIYASGKDEDALDKRSKYAIYAAEEESTTIN